MSAFITLSDYDASIHAEILDAIIRNDAVVLEMAEDMAIEEMSGYMKSRYDVDQIFNKTGSARNPVVLMMGIDIVLYHLHSAHNPQRFPDIRKERYNRAVSWLKSVQKGDIVPSGMTPLTEAESGLYSFTSNTKRITHY